MSCIYFVWSSIYDWIRIRDQNFTPCISFTNLGGHSGEFLQIPAWYFDHTVIQTRLEARGGGILVGGGDGVPQLGKGNPQGQFGGHVGQGVTGGFTGQGRTTGQAGIHLYDVVLQK